MPSKFVHTANELAALFFYGLFYALHSPFLLVRGVARGRPGPLVFVTCAALLGLHAHLLRATPLWEAEAALNEVYASAFAEMSETDMGRSNNDRWRAFARRLDQNSLKYGFDSWQDLNEAARILLGREAYERCMAGLSVAPGRRTP